MFELSEFLKESNHIEGLDRGITHTEIEAAQSFLVLPEIDVSYLDAYVKAIVPTARLRDQRGLDVKVGNHRPLPGGPAIRSLLAGLLENANNLELQSGLQAYRGRGTRLLGLVVRGQDVGGYLPRGTRRDGDRVRDILGHALGGAGRPDPGRDRGSQRGDVRCERGVRRQVPAGLVAHQIHDCAPGASSVVEVCNAVREARTQVKQGQRGSSGEARVAVRSACADAFEQPQDGANAGYRV